MAEMWNLYKNLRQPSWIFSTDIYQDISPSMNVLFGLWSMWWSMHRSLSSWPSFLKSWSTVETVDCRQKNHHDFV